MLPGNTTAKELEVSITNNSEHYSAVETALEAVQRVAGPVVAFRQPASERADERRDRLGSALEEIRSMGSELDDLKAVAAERASTIRERDTHIAYLESRIDKLEDEVGIYMRTSVALAQQQEAIATLCEKGRQLAAAAAAVEGPSDEA